MLSRLLQLASPALPVGAYSYSSALEWGIESGVVHDEASARRWIADALVLGLGSYEAPLMLEALGLWRGLGVDARASHQDESARRDDASARMRLLELNLEAVAARETAELRLESTQMGYSLGQWIGGVCPATPRQAVTLQAMEPLALPLAWALAAERLGLDDRAAVTGLLWGFVENQAMVLMKALPMGQMAAQRLLLALGPEVEACAERALALEPEARSNAAPGLAIASARHETQYSRLFRS